MGNVQGITELAPKILKIGFVYTDSKMCWLEALAEGVFYCVTVRSELLCSYVYV